MKKETKKNREGAEASLLRWFRNGAVAAVVVMSWWMAWLEWENARAGERFPLAAVCSLIPVIFLAGSFLSSRLRERRDRKRALQKAAAFRILEEKEGQAQESSMGGRLCFVGCSRTFYWFQGLSALLMVYYLVLVWMEQDELAQSGLSGLLANLPLWIFYLGAVWLVRISMYFYVNRQILTVLTLRDQPLTAAFAYLSAICRLSPGPIVFRIWVDNAAVCLIRGGWYEEALELAEPETAELRPWEKQLAGWQPPESRGGLFWKSQLSLTAADIPLMAVRSQISSAIDILIHLGRLRDRSRRVLAIEEVGGIENGEIAVYPLYRFEEKNSEGGREQAERESKAVEGQLKKIGELKNVSKLAAAGYEI